MKNFTQSVLLFCLLLISPAIFAQDNFWKDIPEAEAKNNDLKRIIIPEKYRTLSLNTSGLRAALNNAPQEFSPESRLTPLIMLLPMPDGTMGRFSITSYSMMEPGLQAQFPEIRTFSGQGIDDPTATVKLDWTEFGFHAMILSPVKGSVWIDPYSRGDKEHYITYFKKDLTPRQHIEVGVLPAEGTGKETINAFVAGGPCLAGTLRSYRLAVACTGEYAQAVGGTTAPLLHSAIVTSVNRVNGVYEQEVSIRLVLIANNNLIEFLTPAGDQFTGNDNATILINESQTVINNNIGSANYDIGHTFSTGGGGLAQLGCVCTANKARGITGLPNPVGDAYDIDFVAHEMGHQFGGNHTFNANTGNCNGNGTSTTNAEPGSGSTIMAYAGICTNTNDLQPNSDPQFHAISFDQIGTFTRSSTGSTCGTTINTGNTAPVVNAGSDYTIPVSTPFMLTGSATDANNDILTYSWEQIDVGGTFSNWNVPTGATAPLFRSFRPTTSRSRTFPRMSDIVNNVTTIGEILPATARTVKFRLTARDNRSGGGGICYDEANVVTSGTTAFNVTSQATATTWVANGTNTATITWTVAGTTAAPFNVANVDILFSIDGGYTYPFTLLSNTPNDGSQAITIPAATTTKGRVMVKSVGNIFFDINLGDITISSTCGAEGAVVAPATTVTASAGSAPLNLGLSPQYSTPLTIAGTLQTTDPISSLAVLNTATAACAAFLNEMKYDTYVFTPSTTATYTFTLTGVFPTVMNLYSTSFDPSNSCTNFLKSNSSFTSPNVSIGTSLSQALTAGNTYVIVVGTFSNTQPTLPAPYTVAVASVPAGGNIYGGSGIYINPGAGFNYAYLIVNNATGVIRGISATANLTNSATYPVGTYTVYGLSYASSIANLNTYVGGNFSALVNAIFTNPAGFCASFSKNAVTVNITASAVPVTFLGLTARKSGSKVILDWRTASEQNSAYFNVQRADNSNDFNGQIGRVTAAGNSSTIRQYSFTDVLPLQDWNYYRIEQVDLTSDKTYSNTVAVNFSKSGNLVLVYPNPATTQLNIEYSSETNGSLNLQIIDGKGAIVLARNINVSRGRTITNLNVSNLSAGVYMLRYTEPGGNSSSVKFMKQ